jgi:LPXTG-motif cell wall-anchored protein
MNWSVAGAILMALAVGLGAFGAHGLRGRLDDYRMGVYERAVFYHFVHALGLLIVAFLPKTGTFSEFATSWVGTLLVAGIFFFSGSLYLLAITGNRMLGAITPIGGVCFIAAWMMLAWFVRSR